MTRSLRKFITAPDGRRYSGRWPQAMPSKGEGPYIAALARTVGGACEIVLPVGRADVANDTTVFEVEPAKSWQTGTRQVLAYASQCGLTPALALFGEADYLPIFLFLRDRLPGTKLWVYRGHWVEVGSRPKATLRWRPEHDEIPDDAGMSPSLVLPPVHRFDAEVPAEVTDPFERARRAALFERAHMAQLAIKSAKSRSAKAGAA